MRPNSKSWYAVPSISTGEYVVCADTPKGQAELAHVYRESEYAGVHDAREIAKLMAAAPDLLHACKAALAILELLPVGQAPATEELLRGVIAKADVGTEK